MFDPGCALVVLDAVDHVGHFVQPDGRAIAPGDHQRPIIRGVHELAVGLDVVGGVRSVQRADGRVDIPAVQRAVDFIQPQMLGVELVGIHLHADRVLRAAPHLHLRDARDHRQALGHQCLGVFVELPTADGWRW